VLTAFRARPTQGFQIKRFEKVGRRGALAVAVVSLASLVRLERGRVAEARLAWGSVGPTVWRCPRPRRPGRRTLGLSALTRTAKIVSHEVKPIDDLRASADYRRQVAGNLLLRLAVL
jgi:xanthine dehydrogenase FAD-binding subunit